VALAAGTEFTLALRSDGSVWAWGSNAFNDLGQVDPGKLEQCPTPFSPPVYCSTKPLQVVGPKGQGFLIGMTAVSAEASPAGLHAMALHGSGSVWSWGVNDMGQLGNGKSEEYQASPVQVVGPNGQGFLTKVGAIAVGGKFSVALRTDGTVWAWGINDSGQLGQNTGTGPQSCTTEGVPCSLTPVQVKGPRGQGLLTNVAAVVAGDSHVVAGVRP
jgi:alpha-tubulin suppressor-like RCC1 family protein